jgi:sulfur carrier protein
MIRVIVNGERTDTAATTLADLLIEQGLSNAKCATAVNEDFVPADARAATLLAHGDRIEIVAPRQGG